MPGKFSSHGRPLLDPGADREGRERDPGRSAQRQVERLLVNRRSASPRSGRSSCCKIRRLAAKFTVPAPARRREEHRRPMALLRTATSSDLGPVIQPRPCCCARRKCPTIPDWAELRAASRDFLTPWEPLWAADELPRSSFRRRVRHYLRDLREDMGYALFIFCANRRRARRRSDALQCAPRGDPGLYARLLGRRAVCPPGLYDGGRSRCYPFRVRFARTAPARGCVSSRQ